MKQLLPFTIGYETYALELVEVQEVVENQKIYPFPGSPTIVAGAISFHGRIVPVIDLALLLDLPSGALGQRLIVLVNQRGPVALGVDQVQNYTERSYINDIINWRGKMVGLFDLEQLQLKLESLCAQVGG